MATKTKRRKRTTAVKRRRTKKSAKSDRLTNFFVPLVLMIGIIGCLGVLGFMGLRTVSASKFFEVTNVKVTGNNRVTTKRIETIVNRVAVSGVWDTDIDQIRAELERVAYIRHASVSRILPGTIKVQIEERKPVAVARIGDSLKELDSDGTVLGDAPRSARNSSLILLGWDESIEENAEADNLERLEVYRQLVSEWKQYDLVSRVSAVDLESTRNVEAHVIDSGEIVVLSLGNEKYVERLKEGLKHSKGQGKRVSKVELNNTSPVVVYR